MVATFLVAVNVDENADLVGFAEQIQEDLSIDGYEVQSVKPWDRAALAMQSFTPGEPVQQQPVNPFQSNVPTGF